MPEHRCKYRFNTLLNWRVGRKVKSGVLFKLFHADPSTSQRFDGSLDTDLNLFQIYSLNKQRRWEIQEKINQKFMELLQELNENLELMVFQRTSVYPGIDSPCFPYFTISLQSSKIKKQYQISKNGMYQEQIFGGVGRFYGSTTKNVQDTPTTMEVVTYHIGQEPRNWKKVYTKDFYKCRWDRHDGTYLRKSQFDPKSLKYDLDEFYEDNDEFDHDIMGIPSEIQLENPQKFYNFMDHLVEKPRRMKFDYVIIY